MTSTLRVMLDWAVDEEDEYVRRLASERSRPRLPLSFKLQANVDDPDLTYLILANLAQDPRLHVRKSVANHLNDVSKEHPEWLLDTLAKWPRDHPHPSWIAKRALRTLIKAGHPGALSQLGPSNEVTVDVHSDNLLVLTSSVNVTNADGFTEQKAVMLMIADAKQVNDERTHLASACVHPKSQPFVTNRMI